MTEADIIGKIHGRIRRMGLGAGNGIITGIGDDCAIFRQRDADNDLIFTADMMHEGVHFTLAEDAADVGHKALTRSLSDCAAMGARPLFCLISLAFPGDATAWTEDFYTGLTRLARKHKVVVAGGDLSNTEKISCDVMVCGEVPRGQALLRSNARPGDRICVSGPLGKAALALEKGSRYIPKPRLELGAKIREIGARCAMDLSDGVSVDLARLCLASRCAAEISALPVAKGALLSHALHGGEDYELLFTVPKTLAPPARVHVIGEIVKGPPGQVRYQGETLARRGWDHFRTL